MFYAVVVNSSLFSTKRENHWLSATLKFTMTKKKCTRSSDPFYIVTYYIKWVTTSLTDCSRPGYLQLMVILCWWLPFFFTVCPRSLAELLISTKFIKMDKSSWIYGSWKSRAVKYVPPQYYISNLFPYLPLSLSLQNCIDM